MTKKPESYAEATRLNQQIAKISHAYRAMEGQSP